MEGERFVDVHSRQPVISPSLVVGLRCPSEDWLPPKQFLLGVGQPFKTNSWRYSDNSNDELLIAASQMLEETEGEWEFCLLKSALEHRTIVLMAAVKFRLPASEFRLFQR